MLRCYIQAFALSSFIKRQLSYVYTVLELRSVLIAVLIPMKFTQVC